MKERKPPFSLHLDPGHREWLDKRAEEDDRSVTKVINRLIKQEMQREKENRQ